MKFTYHKDCPTDEMSPLITHKLGRLHCFGLRGRDGETYDIYKAALDWSGDNFGPPYEPYANTEAKRWSYFYDRPDLMIVFSDSVDACAFRLRWC